MAVKIELSPLQIVSLFTLKVGDVITDTNEVSVLVQLFKV